jgi:CRP-like cAMP-binding protein
MPNYPLPDVAAMARVPLFAGLDSEVLAALARLTVARAYGRGQIVFLQGEPCAGLYVVATGGFRIYKLSPQGREQVLHHLGPGDTFNEVAALDGGPNPASVAATADAVLWLLSRDDIKRLAQTYPSLAWALIESIARRARHLVDMVEDLSLRSVKARVAKLLLTQAQVSSPGISIERDQMISQSEMAARLGTVREMVGRALRDLADDGLISMDRQRIVVSNLEGLAAIAEGW